MDSFEINKIIAAVLVTVLLVFGISKTADFLFNVKKPNVKGYKVEISTTTSTQASTEAQVDITALLALGNIDHGETPLMVSTAEYDPIDWERYSIELLLEMGSKFDWIPRYKQMSGHNHVSQVYSIGSGDNGVGPDIIDFIKKIILD